MTHPAHGTTRRATQRAIVVELLAGQERTAEIDGAAVAVDAGARELPAPPERGVGQRRLLHESRGDIHLAARAGHINHRTRLRRDVAVHTDRAAAMHSACAVAAHWA